MCLMTVDPVGGQNSSGDIAEPSTLAERGQVASKAQPLWIKRAAEPESERAKISTAPNQAKEAASSKAKSSGNKIRKASLTTVESALEVIDPSSLEYEEWRNVGFALHSWSDGEDYGLELWDQWSQCDQARYDAQALEGAWRSMERDNKAVGITIGTLLKMAIDRGWQGGNGKPSVSFYADRLEELLPRIVCIGSEWFVAENGVLRPREKDQFRPQAQEILLRGQETSRLAREILNTIEGRRQVTRADLRSFAMVDGEGAILLNCRNGILRVTADTVNLLPHSTDHHFTRQIAAAYDLKAESACFERIVTEALPEEEDQHLFLLFAAYTLMPNCDLHAALICHGQGGTGKSTVWGAIANTLGSELVLHVSLRQLCDGRNYSVPRLRFAALNVGTEAPSGELAESDMLKSLICGEPVEARAIYGRPEKLEGYSTKFVFASNHLPRFKSGTDAELRRLRFLQFDHKPQKIDPLLPQKLALEKDGIFSHLMLPRLKILLRDPIMPEGGQASRVVKARFSVENDPLQSFIADCCDLDKKSPETKDRLFSAFLAWAKGKGIEQGLQVEEHFFRVLRSRNPNLRDYRPKIGDGRPYCLIGLRLKEGVPLLEKSDRGEIAARRSARSRLGRSSIESV